MNQIKEQKLKELYQRHRGEPGFPFTEWNEFQTLVRKAYLELLNVARNKPPTQAGEGLITYGELGARIGLSQVSEWFLLKIKAVVGACSEYEHEEGRPLISSIVVNKETLKPGAGYWGLPGIPSHLQKPIAIWEEEEIWNEPGRLEFWVTEVKKVHEYWAKVR